MAINVAATGETTRAGADARLEIFRSHQAAVASFIRKHGGAVVGQSAEAVILEFASAVASVDCAIDIERAIAVRNRKLAPENRVYFQIGIHVGEITASAGKVSGEGVKLVAHLGSMADLGGIVISGPAFDQVADRRQHFQERETITDSDYPRPVRVYVMEGATGAGAVSWTARPVLDQSDEQATTPTEFLDDSTFEGLTPEWGDVDDATIVDATIEPRPTEVSGGDAAVGPDTTTITVLSDDAKNEAAAKLRRHISETVEAHERVAEGHIAAARPYDAVHAYDQAIEAAVVLPDANDSVVRLQTRREAIETGLVFTGSAVLEASSGSIFLHVGVNLDIGRLSSSGQHGVTVGCRLASRIGRQTRVSYESGRFLVTDLGSTNGTFLDDRFVEAEDCIPLDRQAAELSLGGGREPPTRGPCRIKLTTMAGDPSPLVAHVVTEGLNSAEQVNLADNWPGMEEDCRKTWILMTGPVLIGSGPDCAVEIGGDRPGALARIDYDDGYSISACSDETIFVNEAPVLRPVFLGDGVEIGVGGSRMRFVALQ